MLKKIGLLTLFSFSIITIGNAKSYQDLNALVQLAKTHIEKTLYEQYGESSDIQVSAGNIDQRVRLQECQVSPKTEMEFGQIGQKNITVKISCSQPHPWAIRIPIHVAHFSEVVVTKNRITKDNLISSDDLAIIKKDITQLPSGYFSTVNETIGQIAKNEIQSGMILKQNMIKQPTLIKRGDHVKILVKAPGITVESNGIAQKDGVKSQLISVKNTKSNKIIEATVQEPGVVTIFL